MAIFIKKAPVARMFVAPGAYHEILFEQETIREAALKVITDFFSQRSDDITLVPPCYPLQLYDPVTPIYSAPELLFRGVGIAISALGIVAGLAMIFGDRSKI